MELVHISNSNYIKTLLIIHEQKFYDENFTKNFNNTIRKTLLPVVIVVSQSNNVFILRRPGRDVRVPCYLTSGEKEFRHTANRN